MSQIRNFYVNMKAIGQKEGYQQNFNRSYLISTLYREVTDDEKRWMVQQYAYELKKLKVKSPLVSIDSIKLSFRSS